MTSADRQNDRHGIFCTDLQIAVPSIMDAPHISD
jgi:hypothetical protein